MAGVRLVVGTGLGIRWRVVVVGWVLLGLGVGLCAQVGVQGGVGVRGRIFQPGHKDTSAAGVGQTSLAGGSEPPRVRAARRFLARRGWAVPAAAAIPAAGPGYGGADRGRPGVVLPEASGGPGWVAAGPAGVNSALFGLVSGRVSSVAFDPSDGTGNRVFVGTTGGGVWASQNAAAGTAGSVVFQPLTDGLGVLSGALDAGISVGAVTVQPGGTGVVLAGLGDPNDALDSYYGAGLLRSADGGKTWSLVTQTVDLEMGLGTQDYSFLGEGFAGFAWSGRNVQTVVAAVSQAYEGTLVNAGKPGASYEGLYYSQDGGVSWHLARITDLNGLDVQGPLDGFTLPDGNGATAVVWNPVRQLFVAAVRYHGYYTSSDGVTWTQMAAQPGVGLTAANCPTEPGSPGVAGCPIFRGALAVNSSTGDTFAWSVDAFNQDQGIWQDQCGLSGGVCGNAAMSFGVRLNTAALEVSDGNGAATIENGDYNLALAAVPGGLGTGQDTLVFAGANDLWKCSLANSCQWRNTTNVTTCASAGVGAYQHAVGWDAGNPALVLVGNDSGLWRSMDGVGETGGVCAGTDAGHWQNLNGGLSGSGGLAEVESLVVSAANPATIFAGLGANGFAGVVNDAATAGGVAGPWNEVLGGEGGAVAMDPTSSTNSWYANAEAGVAIYHCTSSALCTAAGFGTTPVIGQGQVGFDGLSMPYAASFRLDAADPTQVLIGTCRVWRGNANGSGWTGANAVSLILDGTGGSVCNGNALIRTVAAGGVSGVGEQIYVGMAGAGDGGATVAGHVFTATVKGGVVGAWTDLAYSPVSNSSLAFNALGGDVSGLYVDPHDGTGGTVYATVEAFSGVGTVAQQVYRSTDAGQHWTMIASNLPNAPVNAVVVDPQDVNTVYVGLDVGVYATRAVGTCGTTACWAAYGTGLPASPVTELAVANAGTSAQVLTAGTYGRGVWQVPLASIGGALTTATVTPVSFTFANQTVGTTGGALGITVKNTGRAALLVTGVTLTGGAAGDFAVTNSCVGVSVATNATCPVRVTFTPTQAGVRSATVAIAANVSGGQLLVPVSGTGLSTGSVTLQPASVNFGTLQWGQTSAAQTITVQNVGGSTVTVGSQGVTLPFKLVSTTCTAPLPANTACAVTVAFVPTQVGAVTGTFTFADSAGLQTAVLSGVGVTGPTDTLSTSTLNFAATVVGQSSVAQAVQITNSGGLPLTGIGTAVAGDFVAVSNCGGQLAANSSCGVSVTYVPTVTGTEAGTLTISDALRSQVVKLTGFGLKPAAIKLGSTTLAFGGQQLQVASAAKVLTITNSGGGVLANPGFTVTGPGAASFVASSGGATPCGSVAAPGLASGASCTEQVVFTPGTAGATTATLTVTSSSFGVVPATVALTGTGLTPPALGVTPAVLNLGNVVLGSSSNLFTVQVTNTGQVALTGPTFGVTGGQAGDFALSVPGDVQVCTGTLAPGASCYEQVTFSPSVVGAETATLVVTGANAVPSTATVTLTGVGQALIQLQASPVSVVFPVTAVGQTSAMQVVTISNVGKQAVNGLTVSLTGPYKVVAGQNSCPAKLGALNSCSVGVVFAPTGSGDAPGALTATVTNAGVAALTVGLDGTGLVSGAIGTAPTAMTFGSVVVQGMSAAQTLTVTNTGSAALTGLALSVTADYGLTGNSCGGTLGVGASCTTGVRFQPSVTGNRPGTLTVTTTSTGVGAGVVSLSGQGIVAGALTAAPAVVSFGTVTVGQTSVAQTVTLTNAGATTLGGVQFLLAGDYGLGQNTCGSQIASGATCGFAVNFSPSLPGTRIGSVTVTSTNSGFSPLVVGLTGTGLASASLGVRPSSLGFGSVLVGANSAAQSLTVTNAGTGTLQGLSLAATGPFSVGTGSCGGTLAGGGSCVAPVVFTPVAGGSVQGVVTVGSTTLGVVAVQVPVTGTGVAPAKLQGTPTAVAFGGTTVGTAATAQTVTIANVGGLTVGGLVLASTGPAAGDFVLGATSCTGTLAAGATCSVLVSFQPSVTGGRQGFLTATSTTAGVAAVNVSLTGTGLTPAALGIAPGSLTFGATLLGQLSGVQTLTVSNGGQTGITDLVVGVTAGFQVSGAGTTCGSALVAGGTCLVGVVFAPALGGTAGTVTGSVTVSSAMAAKAGTAAVTAVLSGTAALPPGIVTSPGGVVLFGTTGVGQAGVPVALTVTNSGTLTALTGLTLTVDGVGTGAGFGVSGSTCGATLAAGATCTANVTLVPTSAGPLTGTLTVASANSAPVKLQLGGVGFDFRLVVVGSATSSVVQGQTGNFTLSVTPVGGASGVMGFQCANVPTNALCLFNPSQLGALPAGVAGNVVVSVSTGGSGVGTGHAALLGGSTFLLCGAVLWPVAGRRRRWLRGVAGMVVLVGMIGGVTSCAGSGGSGGEVRLGGGTPPGSYTIPVTASSLGVTHSVSVTLVVN